MPKQRNWKHEYQTQLQRGDDKGQIERQRARRALDAKGVSRAGKDIDHKTPIRAGGKSVPGNLRLRSRKANRSDNGK